jgi:hypothetical protein
MAVIAPWGPRTGQHSSQSLEGSKMQFCVGDTVRKGLHVGTVTDVGTVLIQVRTSSGVSRMACPWELVRVRPSPDDLGPAAAAM